MAYDLAKVTANGNNLIAQILANKSSLSIDKIEISDTQLPSTTDISTMTSVPKVVQTVSANGFSKNSNALIISTVVDNSSMRADYKAWIFGIWGSDSQNGQSQLIAVITSTNSPDTIPAFSGRTPVSYTYKFNIGFSNASQIQFNMIDDSFATNDTVVHTTGDETIDGQKKFKTDPTDGAGNAYAKAVDVNQQLDKKVTDNKDGTEQINGVKVQPFNKLSDSVGGRNFAVGPGIDIEIVPPATQNKTWLQTTIGNVTNAFWNTFAQGITQPVTLSFEINTVDDPTKNNLFDRVIIYGFDWGQDYISGDNYFSISDFKWVSLGANNWKGICTRKFNKDAKDVSTTHADIDLIQVNVNHTSNNYTILNNTLSLYWGTQYIDWTPAPEDKADDSKVVHNSGNEEIGGQKTFGIAPIDKTTGNPYITKDGVPSLPSDIARTGQSQTFTAAQTFSIAPTITDASKDKGDNQAATMADLKSLEKSAWHKLDGSLLTSTVGLQNASVVVKIIEATNQIEINFSALVVDNPTLSVIGVSLDLSSLVDKIVSANIYLVTIDAGAVGTPNGAILTFTLETESGYIACSGYNGGLPTITYNKLV